MPCIPIPGGFACTRGRRANCDTPGCGKAHTALCDFPVTRNGQAGTCDRKMCQSCRRPQGPGKDYCPPHASAKGTP